MAQIKDATVKIPKAPEKKVLKAYIFQTLFLVSINQSASPKKSLKVINDTVMHFCYQNVKLFLSYVGNYIY